MDIDHSIKLLNDPSDPLYFSDTSKDKIIELEGIRNSILLNKEADIRMKSRALRVQVGDENTKYFHRQFNIRKNINSIRTIRDVAANIISSQSSLEHVAISHFQSHYMNRDHDLLSQSAFISHISEMFSVEDNNILGRPITKRS